MSKNQTIVPGVGILPATVVAESKTKAKPKAESKPETKAEAKVEAKATTTVKPTVDVQTVELTKEQVDRYRTMARTSGSREGSVRQVAKAILSKVIASDLETGTVTPRKAILQMISEACPHAKPNGVSAALQHAREELNLVKERF